MPKVLFIYSDFMPYSKEVLAEFQADPLYEDMVVVDFMQVRSKIHFRSVPTVVVYGREHEGDWDEDYIELFDLESALYSKEDVDKLVLNLKAQYEQEDSV